MQADASYLGDQGKTLTQGYAEGDGGARRVIWSLVWIPASKIFSGIGIPACGKVAEIIGGMTWTLLDGRECSGIDGENFFEVNT